MMYDRVYKALVISFGVALSLSSNQAFAGSAAGGFFYGPANGGPEIAITEPISGGVRYTCTVDIPWDWVHRCPPLNREPAFKQRVTPIVPGCPAETVRIGERTVTIVRCR